MGLLLGVGLMTMRSKVAEVMMLAAMADGVFHNGGWSHRKQPNEPKPCANPVCDNMHTHNNTCCSAECFKGAK